MISKRRTWLPGFCSTNSRRSTFSSELQCEKLEDKNMLTSIVADFTSGIVTIDGSPGTDQLLISHFDNNQQVRISLTVDGVPFEPGLHEYNTADFTKVEVTGQGGNDTLNNSSSWDSLIEGGAGNDVLSGGTGKDILEGGDGNDTLDGGPGIDYLYGDNGDDSLTGGEGRDYLYGRQGDDSYYFTPSSTQVADLVYESPNQGIDSLYFSALPSSTPVTVDLSIAGTFASYVNQTVFSNQSASLENVTGSNGNDLITGNSSDNQLNGLGGRDTLSGGDGNDVIDGGSGIDYLYGENGDDSLTGGEGRDYLYGRQGNDTYYFTASSTQVTDLLYESPNQGNDTLNFSSLPSSTPVTVDISNTGIFASYVNQAVFSNQTVSLENIIGSNGNDQITGNSSDNQLSGLGGNDSLTGGDGNDIIDGGPGIDYLYGDNGDDSLTGGEGRDYLYGRQGDDSYYFTPSSIQVADLIYESPNQGIDSLNFSALPASTPVSVDISSTGTFASYVNQTVFSNQTASLENVIGSTGNDLITGNSSDNQLSGLGGDDTVSGVGGDDTILGGDGNDTLSGGDGDDHLQGQDGNDIYLFTSSIAQATDHVYENLNEGTDSLDFSSLPSSTPITIDLSTTGNIATYVNQTVFSNQAAWLENVTATNGDDQITGNNSNNQLDGLDGDDSILGLGGNDTLTGNEGNDILDGGSGIDYLYGDDGDDSLTGGEGRDYLYGRKGNDSYIFTPSSTQVADLLYESPNQGTDSLIFSSLPSNTPVTVDLSTTGTVASYVNQTVFSNQAARFENVIGTNGDDVITGNSSANQLTGLDGNDSLVGLGGNDNLSGDDGNDILHGGSGIDYLYGENGNDSLTGGEGRDLLYGRQGDDSYYFTPSSTQVTDLLYEIPNQGTDSLYFSLLPSSTPVNVDLSITGNFASYVNQTVFSNQTAAFENVIGTNGDDQITGNSLDNDLKGLGGDDSISGLAGVDTLWGGDGNDTLNGGIGDDGLHGNDGSDNYVFDTATSQQTDWLFEAPNQGTDTLSFTTLATNDDVDIDLSRLTNGLIGSHTNRSIGATSASAIESVIGGDGDDTLIGNAANNSLYGQNGNDQLDGLAGNDILIAGNGDDTASGGQGNDTIFGSNGDDVLYGGDGNDFIDGGANNDRIRGNDGADVIQGNAGDDSVFGGLDGNIDNVQGGTGFDRIFIENEAGIQDAFDGASFILGDAILFLENADQTWTDPQIEHVDAGLEVLYQRVDSNVLASNLQSDENGGFDVITYLIREDVGGSIATNTSPTHPDTDRREIRFSDAAFTLPGIVAERVVVHEFGHSWHDLNFFGVTAADDFFIESGWTVTNQTGNPLYMAASGNSEPGPDYWYLADSEFAPIREDAGRRNPFEDWSTMWEQFFFVSETASGDLGNKLGHLTTFMNAAQNAV